MKEGMAVGSKQVVQEILRTGCKETAASPSGVWCIFGAAVAVIDSTLMSCCVLK